MKLPLPDLSRAFKFAPKKLVPGRLFDVLRLRRVSSASSPGTPALEPAGDAASAATSDSASPRPRTFSPVRILVILVLVIICVGAIEFWLTTVSRKRREASDTRIASNKPIPSNTAPASVLRGEDRLAYELDLDTAKIGNRFVVFAYTASQAQIAQSDLTKETALPSAVIVSLPILSQAVTNILRSLGLPGSAEIMSTRSRSLRIDGAMPTVLSPIYQAALARIRKIMSETDLLREIQIVDGTTQNDVHDLLATYVGAPRPVAFLADGPHAIGDLLYGHFRITAITSSELVLTSINAGASPYAKLVLPVRGPARLESLVVSQEAAAHLRAAIIAFPRLRSSTDVTDDRQDTDRPELDRRQAR